MSDLANKTKTFSVKKNLGNNYELLIILGLFVTSYVIAYAFGTWFLS